ncbi:MAG: D-glycero-beta-D-manno-heptose 1-phosphate adenylyltransferase [Acidobacteria bacterium]|nr:MAG: D-glycero-beta-D-manno-heptose 1-phosphate adenylyltransferase [Acidobacteriota bacterium]
MSKILDRQSLIARRQQWRRQGRRVVFTNGCFDLIHPGHVRFLHQARALGDILVVAINSDRSVRQLKGPGRPILSEDERCEVLAAFEVVDVVTVFDDITPRGLIAALLPDILVKGGDWPLDQIVGREEVEAAGGRVYSLPYVRGYSTTEIIERILAHRDVLKRK